MADYKELRSLMVEGGLSDRVLVAILDVANDVQIEDSGTANHANRYAWAAQAFRDPQAKVMGVLGGVLIANQSASVEQILSASDTSIKSAVAALVDLFAGAETA